MSEPKPKSSNMGLFIALVVGLMLVVPCVVGVVVAAVGGGAWFFLVQAAPASMPAESAPRVNAIPADGAFDMPFDGSEMPADLLRQPNQAIPRRRRPIRRRKASRRRA